MSVGVNASNQHTILFNEPEPCNGSVIRPVVIRVPGTHLASSSGFQRQHPCIHTPWRGRGSVSICPASGKSVSSLIDRVVGSHFVAMPLHLASMLRATLSPSRRCLALPRTVATCLMGWNASPSFMCHSTLPTALIHDRKDYTHQERLRHVLAAKLVEYLREERYTGEDRFGTTLPEQVGGPLDFPDNIPTVIERRCIFGKPSCDL